MRIVFVAAENGAIPGGKVGGMADVLRELPGALAGLGHRVEVIVPGYQAFSTLPGSGKAGSIEVEFRGTTRTADVFLLEDLYSHPHVRCWVIDHPLLAPHRPGEIYCDDPPERPFATDASKFAFFCAAVCEFLTLDFVDPVDVIHLHDWHTAPVALLARFDPAFRSLDGCTLVYTIHNLALQGIRPLAGDDSSLAGWFPRLRYSRDEVVDPRYRDCFNPVRAAINLCHRVHTVSPTYAREIQRSNDPTTGFHGGEGLEGDLQRAAKAGRLAGILNGCEYPGTPVVRWSTGDLLAQAERQLHAWIAEAPYLESSHFFGLQRLSAIGNAGVLPEGLITFIGRLTPQKVQLLQVPMAGGKTCVETLLDILPDNHLFVMLGSGDQQIERFFTGICGRRENFLFLKGFSNLLPDQLYAMGDLFLMPSSFEPCGISQMLAMRAGQPCVVHGVGGLADTVSHLRDGFVFDGGDSGAQARALVDTVAEALALKESSPKQWQGIVNNAAAKRFPWRESAERYCTELYGCDSGG